MRAISLWQPWASLWLTQSKIHETRHWSTPYRGSLAVHAAKRPVSDPGEQVAAICVREFGTDWRKALPRGAIIGFLELIDCVSTEAMCAHWQVGSVPTASLPRDYWCGDFSEGRFAWRGAFRNSLQSHVPFVGRQGFFNVPDEVLANG
jgi:hypothetical protein